MKKYITICLSTVLSTCFLITLTGCDAESVADSTVTISPTSATISEGQSIAFTASGGYEYTWSLEEGGNAWGTLSATRGNRTVYTSLANSTSNTVATVRTLYVSSSIAGAGSPSNATDQTYSQIHTAEAYITHIVDSDI